MEKASVPAPTPEDILRAIEVEGMKIVQAPTERTPPTVDVNVFQSKYPNQTPLIQKRISDFVNYVCKYWLSGSIITDSFGAEHTKRREWRSSMHQKYGDAFLNLYNNNKLRANSLSGVEGHLHVVTESIKVFGVEGPKADAISTLGQKFPDLSNYNDLSIEDRIKKVRQIDEICEEFLRIVEKK